MRHRSHVTYDVTGARVNSAIRLLRMRNGIINCLYFTLGAINVTAMSHSTSTSGDFNQDTSMLRSLSITPQKKSKPPPLVLCSQEALYWPLLSPLAEFAAIATSPESPLVKEMSCDNGTAGHTFKVIYDQGNAAINFNSVSPWNKMLFTFLFFLFFLFFLSSISLETFHFQI